MLPRQRLFQSIPAWTVEQLLARLLELRSRYLEGEPDLVPWITLTLTSGPSIYGRLLARGPGTIALHTPGPDPRNLRDDVTVVATSSIVAITVHDVARHAHNLLPAGEVPAADRPAPSRLELKRKLAAAFGHLAQKSGIELRGDADWDGIPHDTWALLSLERVIDDVITGLETILTRDELGREAVRAGISVVQFVQAASPDVSRQGTTLRIACDFEEGSAGRPSAAELVAAIESLL